MNAPVILNGLSEESLANASHLNKLRDSSTLLRNDNKKNMKTKFKALMIDVDGTLMENSKDAKPSQKVIASIKQASKILHVGIATQRPLFVVEHIASELSLSGPSIISGGAQIYDFTLKKMLWEKPMEKSDIIKILKIAQANELTFTVYDEDLHDQPLANYQPNKPIDMFSSVIKDEKKARDIRKKLIQIPTITVNIVPSWLADGYCLVVSHAEATKQHGIFEVAKLLNIDTKDFIVIGDSYNDFPMLMAAGLKVAMGNAIEDLKAIADYIAPSVYEDGVADVIERFVLKQ